MTLFCLGSINLDHFYEVPHLPAPGETILAESHSTGLGGKGANQSVAAAQAGARVVHIGAVGPDGAWAVSRLKALGVDTTHISEVTAPTAHAIINVDPKGENAIVVFPGANMQQSLTQLKTALLSAKRGDMLLLQNETNLAFEAATLARSLGLKVLYAAAPFNAAATAALLPLTDILILNAVEMKQLSEATKRSRSFPRNDRGNRRLKRRLRPDIQRQTALLGLPRASARHNRRRRYFHRLSRRRPAGRPKPARRLALRRRRLCPQSHKKRDS